ncbi:Nicotinate-nucleotide adenylyltransferase [Roseivivax sp. THAF40]|uniref:nicotinate-nucleotide adenylyltransferase n=1 Tax=unclassified Roseivivax TaxID=2639302 RepID=UPI0012695606|nr:MULTISPECIES: nicotinate-nucleotide adenylyltransferase [unclassified Roseivivax]QFS84056.1 Nicotinate-nucleotide adenylyltransferase [Roseivivax sp. THAF197b]QFT47883.1 Nicotinate-nucleotide adenylyltransferase [Roseivivax sp. THAF40]
MSIERSGFGLSLPDHARIGLLGGSFDPPHAGHVHLSREAMKRFGLDRLIWLVSPGNPLKANGPAPLADRVQAARALIAHPRILVSDIEARLGTRYTADTLAALQGLFPRVAFTWLMGADNLAQFHRWDRWREIAGTVPMGVLARPGSRMAALNSPAARALHAARLPAHAARALPGAHAPAWCFLNMPMSPLSSTALRAERAGR